jgi:hypothetical protein
LLAAALDAAADAAAALPASAGSLLGDLVSACSALAAARRRHPRPAWWSAGAAACRSRILQASWWEEAAQHELALMPAWFGGAGSV